MPSNGMDQLYRKEETEMVCMTVFAPPMAMATTQFARVVRYEASASWQMERNTERTPLRMSWVVVTDDGGTRKVCMRWAPAV
jgi:hypothetical protein